MPEPAVVVQEEVQDTSALDDAKLDEAISAAAKEEADTEETAEVVKPVVEEVKPAVVAAKKDGEAAEEGAKPTEEEKLAKQKTDKEAFITRQKVEKDRLETEIQANANRIGELRRQAAELRKAATESVDTVDAIEKVESAREIERQAKETEERSAVAVSRQAVNAIHPEFETLVPKMQDVIRTHLTALGRPEGDIQAIVADFAKNPYAVPPAILSNLAEAAKARMEADTLRADLAKAREENESLKKKGDTALRKVAKAADAPSILSGKAAGTKTGASSIADVSPDQITELSDEQLNALLTEAKDKEKGG